MAGEGKRKSVLDKRTQTYIDYFVRLLEGKFTGNVSFNCYRGGISKTYKTFEPIVVVKEEIVLNRKD